MNPTQSFWQEWPSAPDENFALARMVFTSVFLRILPKVFDGFFTCRTSQKNDKKTLNIVATAQNWAFGYKKSQLRQSRLRWQNVAIFWASQQKKERLPSGCPLFGTAGGSIAPLSFGRNLV